MIKEAVRAYRESAVRGASPVGLVVILYEEAQRCIRAAVRGIEQRNIEQRTLELSHAIRVIGHLEAVLDHEAGREVARNLVRFYNVARAKILEASFRADAGALESLAADFANLAEAWKQVERDASGETNVAERSAGSIATEAARAIEQAAEQISGRVQVEG
jgi:flagellar secretion chaperone FliS